MQRAAKPPSRQERQELVAKQLQAAQVGQLVGGKAQRRDRVDRFLGARRQGVAAAERRAAEEQFKGNQGVAMAQEVALHHGELVEIGEQGRGHAASSRTPS